MDNGNAGSGVHGGLAGIFERLDEAWRLFARQAPLLALIWLALWLPGNLLHNFLQDAYWPTDVDARPLAFGLAWDLLIGPLWIGALLAALGGAPRAVALRLSLSRWGLLFATRLTTNVLVALGLFAFILPGIYLLARWALVEAVTLFEGTVPSEARRRSSALTEGRRLAIFLAWHLPLLAIYGLSWWLDRELAPLLLPWALGALINSVWDLCLAFVVVVLFVYYREGRRLETAPA